MPKDPFVDFISTLADKIRVEKEHRAMMQKINSSEAPIAENKASLENVLSTIQDKIVQEIKKTDPVATEVVPVATETVTDADGWVHPDKTQLNMNYDQAIPYHHEVIKNLLDRIEKLETEIKTLKNTQ